MSTTKASAKKVAPSHPPPRTTNNPPPSAAAAASAAAAKSSSTKPVTSDYNAGASLTHTSADNPNPIQHGSMGQAERAFSAATTFMSGVAAISASAFIGAPLKLVDPKFYQGYMAWTKESFAVLVTTITQWWAPTTVNVSGDASMKGQLYQMDDGSLKCNFPHRLVLMANHQLYTDWLYLWWIAYTNKMHGKFYIILKESLRNLPILGWMAQFYNFVFLSRHWESDKLTFKRALGNLKDPNDPMWMLIFSEGTNLAKSTREKSAAWGKKTGIQDMKHQLLPRATGLQFCLKELKQTTNWLYDCTIAYEGVPKGQYGQDIFTLRSSFFEGRPPKSVNLFWRRFRISEIPLDNDEAFSRWLINRWREKDYILEYFQVHNHFPLEEPAKALAAAEGKRPPKHAKAIGTEVRGGGWDEFLSIFGPITTAAGALSSLDINSATSPDFDALLANLMTQQTPSFSSLAQTPLGAQSQQAVRQALHAAQQSNALPKPILDALLNDIPATPEQLRQTVMTAAHHAGNRELALKASRASAERAGYTPPSPQAIRTAGQQAQDAIAQFTNTNPREQKKALPNPSPQLKKSLPMANQGTMITRPFSTAAMQKAGDVVRGAAAQRTQTKGAALPGQAAPRKLGTPKGAAGKGAATPAQKVKGPSSVASASVGTVKKAPVGKSALGGAAQVGRKGSVANLPAGGAAKGGVKPVVKPSGSGSKPVGTLKYANGVKQKG